MSKPKLSIIFTFRFERNEEEGKDIQLLLLKEKDYMKLVNTKIKYTIMLTCMKNLNTMNIAKAKDESLSFSQTRYSEIQINLKTIVSLVFVQH